MISLKKYLDMRFEAASAAAPKRNELLETTLQSYRSALTDMGKSGYIACPVPGAKLQESLAELESKLAAKLSVTLLKHTNGAVSEHLLRFGRSTAEHLKGKAREVKDLLMVLARTAESFGERDQRYATQLHEFSDQLQAVADLDDLTQVRSSLMKTAKELKNCVDQMKQDSQQAIAQLEAKLSTYENRLKETEDLALRDPLTGLPNRLYLERRMEFLAENEKPFSLAFLDLNDFKVVNDRFGHSAGDSLLKQFCDELKSNIRPGDLVGRWGGDEFVILLDCDLAGAMGLMQRVRKWVFGNYTLALEGPEKTARLWINGAVGLAEWKPGETVGQVIERADRAMYEEKTLAAANAAKGGDGFKAVS